MYLLSAIFSNGGLFVEKGFHYHICANLVVSQEFFFFFNNTIYTRHERR